MGMTEQHNVETPVATLRPVDGHNRRWLLGAGAMALVGGASTYWASRGATSATVAEADALDLWGLAFDQPSGGSLALKAFKGRPLVVNFWATWCPPCVEELPMLEVFYQTHRARGWTVVGLAVDQPSAVNRFLTTMPLSFPIGLAGLGGSDLSRKWGNLAGGLPFTVLLDSDGRLVQRKMGKLLASDLDTWSNVLKAG
jgi:thiol-disulfide isomerase/thioredoxin